MNEMREKNQRQNGSGWESSGQIWEKTVGQNEKNRDGQDSQEEQRYYYTCLLYTSPSPRDCS